MTVDDVPSEQHPLRALGTKPVHPHRCGRAAPDAGRHVADLGVVGHQYHVAGQRDVATSGDRVTMHLGYGRLKRSPQTEEVVRVALHQAEILDRVPHRWLETVPFFGVDRQIVAGTKGTSSTLKHDDVHAAVVVGLLDCRTNVLCHLVRDRIQTLGTVQGEVGLAIPNLVLHGFETSTSHSLLRLLSTFVAGSTSLSNVARTTVDQSSMSSSMRLDPSRRVCATARPRRN